MAIYRWYGNVIADCWLCASTNLSNSGKMAVCFLFSWFLPSIGSLWLICPSCRVGSIFNWLLLFCRISVSCLTLPPPLVPCSRLSRFLYLSFSPMARYISDFMLLLHAHATWFELLIGSGPRVREMFAVRVAANVSESWPNTAAAARTVRWCHQLGGQYLPRRATSRCLATVPY